MSETGAHAVYQYQAQEGPKTCGVDDTSMNETIMTKIDFSSSSQEKQAFLQSRKYIELYIVADNSMYNRFNRREDEIRQRIFGVVNFVNQVYKPLKLFVALTGLEIWSNGNQFEVVTSANTNLNRFSEWREKVLLRRKPHDNAQLLTNIDFDGSTVGLAWIGTLCSNTHSSGVVQDHSPDYIAVGATLAHEMGHNLGMNHDENCRCEASSCIMAPILSHITPRTFSSCSHQDYQNFILERMPLCMRDKPSKEEIVSTPVCGNKFREKGEDCDCGSVEECTDKCCDAATCKLKEGAQCSEEECCSDCRIKPAGSMCRSSRGECDLSEMCDGRSATCPSDRFRMDGSPCSNGEGYCYKGKCPTFRSQCEAYWGAGSVLADNYCYQSNRRNCPQTRYGQCTTLYCSGGRSSPVINGVGYCTWGECKALGSEVLVESGTKCADEGICENGRCTKTPTSNQAAGCSSKCPEHSVCNDEQKCQCDEGWAPPNCDTRAEVESNSSYIVLVVVIIIVVLMVVAVAFVLLKWRKRRLSRGGKGVTNPTFNIQKQPPQQPYNPQYPPGRPMYPPQPPAQSHNPQQPPGRPMYPPQPPAQSHKPQAFQHPAAAPPPRPLYPQVRPQFQQPTATHPQRPMYPPVPPQAIKPNYRR
ncbi:hypothetical protein GDO81_009191 [Engystomops pustulosus]|uniref:Uncharacterized protein n=1 Tax=Engystomops pustulosus TaxID=76066 RepID=A0AAV7BP99_ENGPU|nr:hypothetical protein GDO81_009191 [Engystomops pustulosus]